MSLDSVILFVTSDHFDHDVVVKFTVLVLFIIEEIVCICCFSFERAVVGFPNGKCGHC